jgi:hypothetical protein
VGEWENNEERLEIPWKDGVRENLSEGAMGSEPWSR